ncbi:MAG: helix-turn-helix transcriptional regulator [Pseudomonadota bacterium]
MNDRMKIGPLTPETAILEELGRRLVLMRKNQKLTQAELSEKSGVSESTLRRMETGQDSQFETWLKVLKALNRVQTIETLLPEDIKSPMADVLGDKKSRRSASSQDRPAWGDERT